MVRTAGALPAPPAVRFGTRLEASLAVKGEQAATRLLEGRISPFVSDLPQQRGVHGSDNVAEIWLTFDRVIDRYRLVPLYGSGWQPG